MKRKSLITTVIGLTAAIHLSSGQAQFGPPIDCADCEVGYMTAQHLAESVGDVLGVDPASIVAIAGATPGTFQVTLPDGRIFVVAPIGLAFRHQNMLQRRLAPTEGGGLHLQTQTGLELQLRSAVHREENVIAELLRLGWTNFSWAHNGTGTEIEGPGGTQYCFQPDMRVTSQTPGLGITITADADGNLIVVHPDGIQQRLHACAHDFQQLRDQIQAQVQQQLLINPDGTFDITLGGQLIHYRLHSELHWSGIVDAPRIYRDGTRLFVRYRDGWEQDIIEVN